MFYSTLTLRWREGGRDRPAPISDVNYYHPKSKSLDNVAELSVWRMLQWLTSDTEAKTEANTTTNLFRCSP